MSTEISDSPLQVQAGSPKHGFWEMAAEPWFWDDLGLDFPELKRKGVKTMQSPPTGFHLLLLATSFLPSFFLPFLQELLCPTFLPGVEDLPFPLLGSVPKG